MNSVLQIDQSASPNGVFRTLSPSSSFPSVPFRFYEPSPSPRLYDPIQGLTQGYVRGTLSTGRAAEIVGLCYDDFIREVIQRGIRLPMGAETLEQFRAEDENLRSYVRGK